MSSTTETKPAEINNFQKWLDDESDQIVKENIQKLVQLDEFQIAGKVYKRTMLKPKAIFELQRLDKEQQATLDDPDKQLEILRKQSKICLDNMTDTDFDNTDGVLLQNVIAACRIIAKGFRKL
jgi:hypothetical protein